MAPTTVNERPTKISLKKLYYALMTDETAETWSGVKVLTMPISLTQTPNFSDASLDGGDRVVAQEAQLDSITIAGETVDLPTEVQADWFGHTVSDAGGLIVSSDDAPPYMAVGYESGSKLVWFYKAKFKPGEEANSTRKKGETAYKTYPFSGEAIPLISGQIKHVVDTRDTSVTETPETFFATVQKPTVTPAP